MRTVAKRGEQVWLVTSEPRMAGPQKLPAYGQVLDLSIGRLYPPHPCEEILKTGDWEMLTSSTSPDADAMLVGVEVMPAEIPFDGFSMIPAA